MFIILENNLFEILFFMILNIYDQTDLPWCISFTLTNFKLFISFITEMELHKMKMLVR